MRDEETTSTPPAQEKGPESPEQPKTGPAAAEPATAPVLTPAEPEPANGQPANGQPA